MNLFLLCCLALSAPPGLGEPKAAEFDQAGAARCLDALRVDPLTDSPFERLLLSYRSSGRLDRLEADILDALGRDDWKAAGPCLLARVQASLDKTDKATATLAAGLEKFPDSAALWELKAEMAEKRRQPAEALDAVLSGLRSGPNRRLRQRQVVLLLQLDRDDEALEAAIQTIAASSWKPSTVEDMVRLFRERGKYPQALRCIEEAISRLPGDDPWAQEGQSLRVGLLRTMGRNRDAWVVTQSILQGLRLRNPEWRTFAGHLLDLAATAETATEVRSFLEKRAGDMAAPAWSILLSESLLRQGEKAKAAQCLAPWESLDAAERDGTYSSLPAGDRESVALGLARAFRELGQVQTAAGWYRAAIRIWPSNEALLALAEILAKEGDIAAYRATLAEIIPRADQPAMREARRLLCDSYIHEGRDLFLARRWEQAVTAMEQARKYAPDPVKQAEAHLWQVLALAHANPAAALAAWPTPEQIPDHLTLQIQPGLEVSAPWLAGRKADLVDPQGNKEPSAVPADGPPPPWTYDPLNPELPVVATAIHSKVVVCQNRAGALTCLDRKSGLPLWMSASAGRTPCPGLLAFTDACLVDAEDGVVRARGLADGARVWQSRLAGKPAALAVANDRLLVVNTSHAVTALSSIDGTILWEKGPPPGNRGAMAMPGRWHIVGQQAILDTGALLSLDPGAGNVLWQYEVPADAPWPEQMKRTGWHDAYVVEITRNSGDVLAIPVLRPHEATVKSPNAAGLAP